MYDCGKWLTISFARSFKPPLITQSSTSIATSFSSTLIPSPSKELSFEVAFSNVVKVFGLLTDA